MSNDGYYVASSDTAWIDSDTTCADIGVEDDGFGADTNASPEAGSA